MDTLDNPIPYLRMPNVSFAAAEIMRLVAVGEMIERLRRLACQKLTRSGLNPSVSARFGAYGWAITVFNPLGPDKEFSGDTLSAAYTDAMAWAIRDEVAEGYATLGLTDDGTRIVETARSSCDVCGAEDRPTATVIAYGIETNACDRCRGVEEDRP